MSSASMQYSSYQWPGLLKHLRQMLIANSPMEEGMYVILTHRFSLEKVLKMSDISASIWHDSTETDCKNFVIFSMNIKYDLGMMHIFS